MAIGFALLSDEVEPDGAVWEIWLGDCGAPG